MVSTMCFEQKVSHVHYQSYGFGHKRGRKFQICLCPNVMSQRCLNLCYCMLFSYCLSSLQWISCWCVTSSICESKCSGEDRFVEESRCQCWWCSWPSSTNLCAPWLYTYAMECRYVFMYWTDIQVINGCLDPTILGWVYCTSYMCTYIHIHTHFVHTSYMYMQWNLCSWDDCLLFWLGTL